MNDATTALIRAIGVKFDKLLRFTVEEIGSNSWASVTFSGVRHRLTFTIKGEDAPQAADAFLDELGEAEFCLRGHILADIALVSRERSSGPEGPIVRIAIEALTMEDG